MALGILGHSSVYCTCSGRRLLCAQGDLCTYSSCTEGCQSGQVLRAHRRHSTSSTETTTFDPPRQSAQATYVPAIYSAHHSSTSAIPALQLWRHLPSPHDVPERLDWYLSRETIDWWAELPLHRSRVSACLHPCRTHERQNLHTSQTDPWKWPRTTRISGSAHVSCIIVLRVRPLHLWLDCPLQDTLDFP